MIIPVCGWLSGYLFTVWYLFGLCHLNSVYLRGCGSKRQAVHLQEEDADIQWDAERGRTERSEGFRVHSAQRKASILGLSCVSLVPVSFTPQSEAAIVNMPGQKYKSKPLQYQSDSLTYKTSVFIMKAFKTPPLLLEETNICWTKHSERWSVYRCAPNIVHLSQNRKALPSISGPFTLSLCLYSCPLYPPPHTHSFYLPLQLLPSWIFCTIFVLVWLPYAFHSL